MVAIAAQPIHSTFHVGIEGLRVRQPATRREPAGHLLGAGPQPPGIPGGDQPAQLDDLVRLGHGRLAYFRQHHLDVGLP